MKIGVDLPMVEATSPPAIDAVLQQGHEGQELCEGIHDW